MAAQFSEVKGWDYLIDTMRSLKDQGVKITCVAAGEGLLLDEIKKEVENFG